MLNKNPEVLSYTDCGCSSVVERQLPKLNVVGSSPITRFQVFQSQTLFQKGIQPSRC